MPVLVGVAQGEELSPLKLGAIAIALTGVALAARPGHAATGGGDRRAAAGWALVSSLGFGVFLAGMAPAAEAGTFWAVAISRVALLALFATVALRLASPLRVSGRDLPRVMVPGLLLFGGTMLYTAATREGDLSVVAVLGSLFPVVTVGLALRAARRAAGPHAGRGSGRGDARWGLAGRGTLTFAPIGARLCDECAEGAIERRLVREGVRGVETFRDTGSGPAGPRVT